MTGRGTESTLGRAAVVTVVAVLAVSGADAEELLYYVEDGRVVFTNTPSRRDARTVPGFEEQVYAALRGDLPASPFDRTIDLVARQNGLSPDLVKAVALVESGLKPDAVSPKGALGLMQLMPATAQRYGVTDPLDPDQSLKAGGAHLRDLLDEFEGDLDLALAAYNAGSGAVRRYGGIPAYPETRSYVKKVRSKLAEGASSRGESASPEQEGDIRAVRRDDGSIVYSN